MFRKLLAVLFLSALTGHASASEPKTWYVYCEGQGHGMHWAVFSNNIWPHPDTENYGRRIGSAAEVFFEASHNVSLEGCSGIQFFDPISAEYSRERTVKLHKKMGDNVYFFNLPASVLKVD